LVLAVISFVIILCLAGIAYTGKSKNKLTNEIVQLDDITLAEPNIAAAFSGNTNIEISQKQPLSFGSLVGGTEDLFIELTPDGHVFTTGKISGQSQHSHIGEKNLSTYSMNPRYRIHPGRLVFNVDHISENGTVRIDFRDGRISDGVDLSNLSINSGPNTSTDFMKLPATSSNRIKFQAIREISNGSIDITFGGRLTLTSNVGGEIAAPMDVNIAVENPVSEWTYCANEWGYCRIPGSAIVRYGANGRYFTRLVSRYGIWCNNLKFGDPIRGTRKNCEYQLKSHFQPQVLASVYQHINYRGETLELSDARRYEISELKQSIGNDVISSLRVTPGYLLKACQHNFSGRCVVFSTDNANLIKIGFNDEISSLEIIRTH